MSKRKAYPRHIDVSPRDPEYLWINHKEINRACDKFLEDRGLPKNVTEEYDLKRPKERHERANIE